MTKLTKLIILIYFLGNLSIAKGDTIDVWILKVDDKIVFNSNENLIMSDQPMTFNLKDYNGIDTLKIYYLTDSGLEQNNWSLDLKDSNNVLIEKFTNPIDSSIRCFPSPCKTFHIRKSHISFIINKLKLMLQERKIKKIFIEFEHSTEKFSNPYLQKRVCVISE